MRHNDIITYRRKDIDMQNKILDPIYSRYNWRGRIRQQSYLNRIKLIQLMSLLFDYSHGNKVILDDPDWFLCQDYHPFSLMIPMANSGDKKSHNLILHSIHILINLLTLSIANYQPLADHYWVATVSLYNPPLLDRKVLFGSRRNDVVNPPWVLSLIGEPLHLLLWYWESPVQELECMEWL